MSELLFMKPFCREVIWGGTALHDRYGYETSGDHTGEAWVVSDRPEGKSIVTKGEFKGKTLKELWDEHRELFGNIEGEDFPLLIKLIDAHDHLSVQVHPDDEYARVNENDVGKTECWYVVDCDDNADIVIGHHAKTRDELKNLINEGKWDDLLKVRPIHKGDFFFIPSGTVHAIRSGTIILEIQQNSNLTYRLYDYGRLQDGKPRELHLDKSIDVINCPHIDEKTENEVVTGHGYTSQILVSCPLFEVQKWEIESDAEPVLIKKDDRFLTVNVLEGSGTVNGEPVSMGDHFIAPADVKELKIMGKIKVITSHI